VEKLLKAKSDIESKEIEGRTSLLIAAENRHKDVFEILLKAHANIDVESNNGSTVLLSAAEYGDEGIISLLLKRNLDCNKGTGTAARRLCWH